MKYVKIKEHPNLVRDVESKAVLNVDVIAKENFLTAREARRKERARIDSLESRVDNMDKKLDLILSHLLAKP